MSLYVSYIDKNYGMQTATNVVFVESFICMLISFEDDCIVSSLLNILSRLVFNYYWEPKSEPIPDIIAPNFYFKVNNLFKPF